MVVKCYKPIIKEGSHLVRSTENPNRVRGLTRDENNLNPDIPEWEEVEIEESDDYKEDLYSSEERNEQLSPEEEKLAMETGLALATVGIWLIKEIVIPWWKNSAWPWICDKGQTINKRFRFKRAVTKKVAETECERLHCADIIQLTKASEQIDTAFETIFIDMDAEEAKQHMLNIIYHMLALANEIQIISNARIIENCENDEMCIEQKKNSEKFLAIKVANCIDRLLSNESLSIDADTSKEIFSLMGGGTRLNGEYVPVDIKKVNEAICHQHKNVETEQ